MTQYIRPTSDQSAGSWTATPLWSKVDDDLVSSPSGDGSTIASDNNTSGDTAQLNLDSSAADPGVTTGHVMRVRWNKSASAGHQIDAVCNLIDPTNGTIATISVTNIGNTEQENTHTLTAGEAGNITDYTALDVAFVRNGDTGGPPGNRRSLVVEAFQLELPDATGAQTISAAGAIASAETFGSDQLNLAAVPSGIASAEAFGTDVMRHYIAGSGAIASAEAFGSDQLNLAAALTGIASAEAFGTLTLELFITGSGAIASAEALGSPELREVQTIASAGAIASAEALGTGQLNFTVFPSSVASAESFGTALMQLYLAASAIASAEALGSHVLSQITTIIAAGIGSQEAFGSPALQLYLAAAGAIPSAEATGSPGLVLFLVPAGIASAEALGAAILDSGGGKTISAAGGIDSAEALGVLLVGLLSARPVRYDARVGSRTARPRYYRPRRR